MNERLQEWLRKAPLIGILVIVGLFVVALLAFSVTYFQEQSDRIRLQEEYDGVSFRTQLPRPDNSELKARAKDIEERLNETLYETSVYSLVREVAKSNEVRILSLTANGSTDLTIGNSKFRVLLFSVRIEGADTRLNDFINTLESQQRIATLMLDKAGINRSAEQSSATIDLKVHFVD